MLLVYFLSLLFCDIKMKLKKLVCIRVVKFLLSLLNFICMCLEDKKLDENHKKKISTWKYLILLLLL